MNNSILNLSNNLQEINKSISSCSDDSLSFDDWFEIAQFYYDWQNTNRLIDEAERVAEENPEQLKELAGTLKDNLAKLIDSLYKIGNPDFNEIAKTRYTLFYDRFKKAADELNPYWKRYCELNNRLDYLPLGSKEYEEAEKECEATKTEHDERQKEVRRLNEEYQTELKRAGDLSGLKLSHLIALIGRINAIAGSIIDDVERFEKEGQI